MKLVFTPTAEAQWSEMDAWWREHREEAPDLFARELAETCALITATPTLGTTYATGRGKIVRRPRPAIMCTSISTLPRRRWWL